MDQRRHLLSPSTDPTTPINYRSGNAAVATITADGRFLATGVGTTYILAYQYAPGTSNIEAVAQQNITVVPAPLTATANNQTIVWDQPAAPLTVTYQGFVNGDTQASLPPNAVPFLTTPYVTGSGAGSYTIYNEPTGFSSGGNYTVTYVNGTITVTALYQQPTVTTTAATAVTGSGATINGIVNPNGTATTVTMEYSTTYDVTLTNPVTATLTTGPATLSGSAGNTNYAAILTGLQPSTTYYFIISGSNPEFTVTGSILSFTTPAGAITFPPLAAVTYGSANVTPAATSTNTTIPITYASSNTNVATITADGSIAIVGAGNTNITASQTGSGLAPATQPFTVNPAPLIITASSPTALYGAGIPAITVTYNAFVNGDTPASLTTPPAVATTAIGSSAVGNYATTASGAVDLNYNITYVAGNLSITPAPLTITANNQTVTYGSAIPALTVSFKGFVNGDEQNALSTQPVAATTASPTSAPGTYPITVFGAVAGNYAITYVPGTLTVTPAAPAAVTLAATAISITGATLNGTVNDDGAATTVQLQYSTAPDLSGAITGTLTSGTSPIVAGSGVTPFSSVLTGLTAGTTYYFSISGSNSIGTSNGNILSFTTPALMAETITFAAPPSQVYGSADVGAGATSTNTTLPITYTSSNTAVATVTASGNIHIISAGSTQITASQAGNASYSAATPVTQTFTVTPASLVIIASSPTAVYGSGIPAITVTYNAFVNGDTPASLTAPPTVSTTAAGGSGVGTYPTTASGAADPNYAISYVAGNLSITPAPLTITANNQTIAFGAAIPALTVAYYGFVNDDSSDNLTTQPSVTTTATAASTAGTYPITVSGAADANYNITYVAGTLTINPLLVFGPLPVKTYGDPDFNPGATGPNVTYTSANTGVATIDDGGDIHIVGAGTSVITASSGGASAQQTLTVNKAPLTVTADNQTSVYGSDIPALTVSYATFVNGDTESSLTTPATAATTATAKSNVGTYPITAGGAVSSNYTFTYVPGTLTITRAEQTITFAPIPTQLVSAPYDSVYNPISNYTKVADPASSAYDLSGVTASSGLPVSFSISNPSLASVHGASLVSLAVGTVTITATQEGNENYLAAAPVSQTFNIEYPDGGDVTVSLVVSPNGDGINDVLKVVNIEQYPDNEMILINRNGVKIFDIDGYNNTTRVFDGHSSITGVLQQQGTYLYLLRYHDADGVLKVKKGFTELRY